MLDRIIQLFRNLLFSPVFVITIENGQAKSTHNKVTKAFIYECNELCKMYKIKTGKIYGIKSDYGITIKFSASIPEEFHQQFRNVWNIVKQPYKQKTKIKNISVDQWLKKTKNESSNLLP